MSVSVYVYEYTFIHTHIHVHTYIHLHACILYIVMVVSKKLINHTLLVQSKGIFILTIFTAWSIKSFGAAAGVGIYFIHTGPSVLTGT